MGEEILTSEIGRRMLMGMRTTSSRYPNPSAYTYENRFFRPFQYALPQPSWCKEDHIAVKKPELPFGVSDLKLYDGPQCFIIPGNHDWFDGLHTFMRYICHKSWFGGWLMPQKKSYFALQLPKGWWAFGFDLSLHGDIDVYQFKFFSELINDKVKEHDSVIIMTHEPNWLLDWYWNHSSGKNVTHLIRDHLKGRCKLRMAGDLHHYMRHSYVPSDKPVYVHNYLVNGCGGAFLHPTHVFKNFKEVSETEALYEMKAAYPSCEDSSKIALGNILKFRKKNWQFDFIGGIIYFILAFSMFPQILAYMASGIKLGTYKSINESVTRIAVYVSLLALYCLGGNKVKAGELSTGTMVSFIGYTFTLTFAVQGLVYTFGDLRGALAAVERINSILSGSETDEALAYGLERQIQPSDVQDEKFQLFVNGFDEKQRSDHMCYMSTLGSSNDVFNVVWSGDLRLEDVHFSYPLRPDIEVLNGLNLTLKSGTITALVGSSGAGKSTIVQLLARFYEPTSGRITVAGEDVRMFDKSEWARVVSIVNQDPVLFSMSVAENIAYGLPDANVSKDDIVKAAKAANAHEFIISLPQGYDTLVGERGGLLSGGQRQRVAIARALLKDAPILILDEATSALDTVSERLVQDALNHLMKGRTTLVIAHRLSTVQNAHQIALCFDGKIAELGTHYELLSQSGQYASLVGSQRLAFE